MSLNAFSMRPATVKDSEVLWQLMHELATYEKFPITGSKDAFHETLFGGHPKVFGLIAEMDQQTVGFVLWFYNYSMFLCQHGLYIESLYVRPEFRGAGYGTKLIQAICKMATEQNCGRVDWLCLDWNQKAMDFYATLEADARKDLIVYRLKKEAIQKIASA